MSDISSITAPPPSLGPGPKCAFDVYDALRADYDERKEARRNRPFKARDDRNADHILLCVENFVAQHGSEHLGFLTLTFPRHRSWKQAMAAFKLASYPLKKEFPGWLRVIDLTNRGVIHIHLLVHVPFDIEAGFNHDACVRIHQLDKLGKAISEEERAERIALRRKLTTNVKLIDLNRRLQDAVTNCGFGWKLELTPIRETPEVATLYLVKGFYATLRLRPMLPKNARVFDFGGSFPRPKKEPSKGQIWYRQCADAVIEAMGETRVSMEERFGPWNFKMFTVMDEILFWFGSDPPRWPRDLIRKLALETFDPPPPPPWYARGERRYGAPPD